MSDKAQNNPLVAYEKVALNQLLLHRGMCFSEQESLMYQKDGKHKNKSISFPENKNYVKSHKLQVEA